MQDYLGWITGLVVLVIFILIVRHERRQARRLTERSRELERLSGELLRVNRVKSEFLANVSHELRTPLNAIVGFVELLRDGVYGELSSRQMGPVQRIEASANHLRHLVDQILDLAKLAAGRLEVHEEMMDLRPFILDVASEVEPLVSEKRLQMSLALSGALPSIRTDPTHIRQILVNLIGNAVKYTNEGSIVIQARRLSKNEKSVPGHLRSAEVPEKPSIEGWITIQVTDTGIGIAPADHERIFEEFEQVNAGPRGDSIRRGTGLGLPISRRLSRLLGGDLTVDSELERGSTFTVWLPVYSGPSTTKEVKELKE